MNPTAGNAGKVGTDLAAWARELDVACRQTTAEQSAAALGLEAVAQDHDRIVVAGGDGTLSEVINAVHRHWPKVSFGLVPLGTGNDLARCLDLPRDDPRAALDLAVGGAAMPIDVIHISAGPIPFCLNVAFGGFQDDFDSQAGADEKQKWGPFAYWFTAAARLTDRFLYRAVIRPCHARFAVARSTAEHPPPRGVAQPPAAVTELHAVAVANGQYLGGGFRLAPKALIDDGLLEVIIFPAQTSLELLRAGIDTLLNRQDESESVNRIRAPAVEIESDPPLSFRVDGETTEPVNVRFEVIPRAVRIACGPSPACKDD